MNRINVNHMKAPNITTIIIIICIIIIGLYASGEVNYFSSKVISEKNITSPAIIIDKVGISEKINNVSLSQGVMLDEKSTNPTDSDIILFGHRTLQGSPFLRLNEIEKGDTVTLEWPGTGEINYTVTGKTIVDPTHHITSSENRDHIFLVTCDPIGSTEHRLIIEGELSNTGELNDKVVSGNPHESYGYIISGIFLILGLIISFLYPKDMKIYILATVLIISVLLFYFCFNPIPSEIIYDKIIILNGGI